MPFFRNSAVNLLNLHYGIHTVVLSGADAFFLIYLLKTGIPIPGVLVSLALILIVRFIIRPFVIPLGTRFGLRTLLIAGTLLTALTYPLLAAVRGIGPMLAVVIAVASIGSTLYWTAYHAWFARLGDDEHRGQQIGAREALAAIVGILSPLLTGWMLVSFGPAVAFGASAMVGAASALPLPWVPDARVHPQVPGMLRAAFPAVLLFAADGCVGAGNVFVWQIALFVSIDENYLGYGGALAFAALAGAVGGMTLGRHIDAGHGKRAVWYALSVIALMVLLRAAATGHAALAVMANALGSLGYCLYIPTVMTPVYTMAKRSACTLRFHVATEGGWDLGGAATLLAAAFATARHIPLSAAILLALPGVAAIAVLLRRYYGLVPAMGLGPRD
ncbi:MAG TPA: MFS transporter [Acetobacteraceae bacterium]|nr:MFS transporter [Acetobacteraceae bacterium]